VASRLTDATAVERLRDRPATTSASDQSTKHLHDLPPPAAAIGDATLDGVVRRRRSTRRFARASISAAELAAFLQPPSRGAPVDFMHAAGTLLETYVIVHAVQGVPSGAYYYRPRTHQLEALRTGDLRQMAGFLSLGQALPRDASAVVYYLANLAATGEMFGERGYRLAELEAGFVAGRAYLAAYAVGRGATGLTFFDHEVTEFFSPHAAGLEPLLVMALGVARKRS
jgi:SagB-type dehydrogenase family enzyme